MSYPQSYFDILNKVIENNTDNYFWLVFGFIALTVGIILMPKIPDKKPKKLSKHQYHPTPQKAPKKKGKVNLYFKLGIWLLITVVCVGGIIQTEVENARLQRDMESGNFAVYTGMFEYSAYYKDHYYARVDLLDENGKITETLHIPDRLNLHSTYGESYRALEDGIFQGTLTYAKESRMIVEMHI